MLRITKTENGAVRGFPGTDARITVFKGIPFADNTSGENRWRVPQPAKNWDGVRECYEFAPITMQKIPGENPEAFYAKEWHVDPEVPMSEDGSLAVNIWTPAKSADEKLPVMVWIFGGGLSEGYAYEMEFDGERMASRGVVLISISYRLNVFGYLAHPELTAENPDAPTNFGFLDQRFALEWIQRNIANFGGDPGNVTIFGQSAGGGSVLSHMCSHESRKLFNRAIIQSVGGITPQVPYSPFPFVRTLEQAEADGVKLLEQLGVKSIEEARKLDGKFIEDKFNEMRTMYGFVIDQKYMTSFFHGYVCNNDFNEVPFMIGSTGDEFLTMAKGENEAELLDWAKKHFGSDEIGQKYFDICKAQAGDDFVTLRRAMSYGSNMVGARMLCEVCAAQGRDLYYYTFDPEIPGDDAGSFHSSDLWFEFETLMKCWRPFDGHHYDLSRKMCNYWTNFAKTGDPNGNDADGTPMPRWEKYTPDQPYGIKFFDEIAMEDKETMDERDKFLVEINMEKTQFVK